MFNKTFEKIKECLNRHISMLVEDIRFYAKSPVDFTRHRKINGENLIRIMLSMGGNSLPKEIRDYFHPQGISVTASAFVQQRSKLKPEAMEKLFHSFTNECGHVKNYRGFRLLAIDGTTVSYKGYKNDDTFMPDHGEINQFHINCAYDLLNQVYLDALIQPQLNAKEAREACQIVKRTLDNQERIFICDRNYGSINTIEHINRIPNAHYVIRVKNSRWKELENVPMANIDTLITINLRTKGKRNGKYAMRKYKEKYINPAFWDFESPFSIMLRIVRFEIDKNHYETIVTDLPKNTFPLSEVKKLYNMRWGIETSFRTLKYSIGMNNFHAKKGESIIQEIFAKLTMYNFYMQIILKAAKKLEGKKWRYQPNFKMWIIVCREYFRLIGNDPPANEHQLGRYMLPLRPGRNYERKMSQRPPMSFLYRVA